MVRAPSGPIIEEAEVWMMNENVVAGISSGANHKSIHPKPGKIRPYGNLPFPDENAPLIGIDVDGVLRDLIGALNGRLRLERPDIIVPEEVTRWNLAEVYPEEEVIYDFILRSRSQLIYDIEADPMPGAIEGFNRLLISGYRIHIITTQRGESIDSTLRWLARFELRPHGVIISRTKERESFDVLLDDGPDNLKKGHDAGRSVVCFDHPYNRDIDSSIPRISTWPGFVEWVEENLPMDVGDPHVG